MEARPVPLASDVAVGTGLTLCSAHTDIMFEMLPIGWSATLVVQTYCNCPYYCVSSLNSR